MPPEANDVPRLMKQLVTWLNSSEREGLPCPLRAAIAHCEFATIHPYFDGNGRTARLLATLILHQGGYDLKGLYSLEEYYARRLGAYYAALTVGPSHNYYFGRAEADITGWLEYFCEGMAESFEAVRNQAQQAAGAPDASPLMRRLDPRQRKVLALFQESDTITSRDVERLFAISARTARLLTRQWTEAGFLVMADAARKSRRYALAEKYQGLR
jgi:Fic family protein